MVSDQRSFLERSCARQQIAVTTDQLSCLLAYIALIVEWNKVFNLVGTSSLETLVLRHIIDSLSVLPHLPPSPFSLLDVGSGAGLPGIPLLIMRPDIDVCLLDAQEKRSVFLSQALLELGLPRARVVCCRVETMASVEKFDLIIARAFSSLLQFVSCSRHLLKEPKGAWYAMKGCYPEEEIKALPPAYRVSHCWSIHLVDSDVSRCLLKIQSQGSLYD